MSLYTESITIGAKFTLGYAKLLVNGVTASNAARKPAFEGPDGLKVVDCNHPMFVFGHLGLYGTRIYTLAQQEVPAEVAAPVSWNDLFKAGVECRDDPKGTIYPEWSKVWEHYLKSSEVAIDKLARMPDSFYEQPHPDPKVRERFATIGATMLFLFNNHPMSHLGQISTWRRCLGLPSAMG